LASFFFDCPDDAIFLVGNLLSPDEKEQTKSRYRAETWDSSGQTD